MEGIELICFQIISAAGSARSSYIEAIQKVKKGSFDEAEKLMKEGEKQFLKGHEVHNTLLQQEASGETIKSSILVMHAEDQLMGAEMFQIIAKELIDTNLKINDLEQKLNEALGSKH